MIKYNIGDKCPKEVFEYCINNSKDYRLGCPLCGTCGTTSRNTICLHCSSDVIEKFPEIFKILTVYSVALEL
jgi:hypothetical protein